MILVPSSPCPGSIRRLGLRPEPVAATCSQSAEQKRRNFTMLKSEKFRVIDHGQTPYMKMGSFYHFLISLPPYLGYHVYYYRH
jgi:hypothetical protein